MATDNRLLEVMADLLAEVHQMRLDNNERLNSTNSRLDRLENQLVTNHAAIVELHVTVAKMTEKLETVYRLDQRIKVLEGIVLPLASSAPLDNR